MSPRARKASDEEVFAAAARAMSRRGPAQLTLGEIAADVGLTPAALVQRFGSKRKLLLALAEKAEAASEAIFAELRAAHRSPLEALREYARCMAGMGNSPRALAHNLAYLQVDLTDPDFHRHTRAMAVATGRSMRDLLDAAVGARELATGTDTAELSRIVQTMLGGSLLSWALYQDGPAEAWVLEDLESVLRPHLVPSGAGVKRPRRAAVIASKSGRAGSHEPKDRNARTATNLNPEDGFGKSRRRPKPA
jgi:AcrR family transcriptional regulator